MYLGIEIGGTKLQLGLGSGDGKLAGLWRGSVDVAAGPAGIRRQITAAVPQLLQRSGFANDQVKGVGVGFGGPVDDATGAIIKSHQIEGWDGFPLAAWLSELLGWPAKLGNDADVAGLGEALFGAGRGMSPVFYITIGSGIGGGLIVEGAIYRGVGRGAAEIGHLRVWPGGWAGAKPPILEHVASGWAIEGEARRTANQSPEGRALLAMAVEEGSSITVALVGKAARQGNRFAAALLERAWASLADAVCHVIALLCPRRIVIGGGVALLGEDLLFEPLRERVASQLFKPFAGLYEIVPAQLGEEVVVHGALALAGRFMGNSGIEAT